MNLPLLKEKHTPLRLDELEGLSDPQQRLLLLERMASSVEGRERFWSKSEKRGINDCWEWQGWINRYGYYAIRVSKTKALNFEAHRISYFLTHGSLPEGMLVCHKCDNKICVNPNHLFIGTDADNMSDKINKGRQTRGDDTRCAKLTTEQVYEIRRLLKKGVTQYRIAKMLGLTSGTIWFIKHRKTWKHLPEDPMDDPMF